MIITVSSRVILYGFTPLEKERTPPTQEMGEINVKHIASAALLETCSSTLAQGSINKTEQIFLLPQNWLLPSRSTVLRSSGSGFVKREGRLLCCFPKTANSIKGNFQSTTTLKNGPKFPLESLLCFKPMFLGNLEFKGHTPLHNRP